MFLCARIFPRRSSQSVSGKLCNVKISWNQWIRLNWCYCCCFCCCCCCWWCRVYSRWFCPIYENSNVVNRPKILWYFFLLLFDSVAFFCTFNVTQWFVYFLQYLSVFFFKKIPYIYKISLDRFLSPFFSLVFFSIWFSNVTLKQLCIYEKSWKSAKKKLDEAHKTWKSLVWITKNENVYVYARGSRFKKSILSSVHQITDV